MKKLVSLFLAFVCIFVLVGCNTDKDNFETTVSRVGYMEGYEIWLGALNREKMSMSSVKHLPIFKFDTLEEFDGFKSAMGEEELGVAYDELPSFIDNTSKYGEEFFVENTLVLVYVPANSGSYRYDVHSIYRKDEVFCVHIEKTNSPEEATDDMAGWFVTVAVPDAVIESCDVFDADLNNFEN